MGEDDLIRRWDAMAVCGAISRNDEAVVVEKLLASIAAARDLAPALSAERDALKNTHWQVEAMQQNALLHDALTRAEVAEAKLAEAVSDRDELDFLLNEGGADSIAALIARAEKAEYLQALIAELEIDRDGFLALAQENAARVTELEAAVKAARDQALEDVIVSSNIFFMNVADNDEWYFDHFVETIRAMKGGA